MERPIQQNFVPLWGLMRLASIPPGVAAVAVPIALYAHGQRDPMKLVINGLEIFLAFAPVLVLLVLVRIQPTVKWFITDTGLMRVIRGDVLAIPWEWIYHMANTKSGFVVQWRYPREPGLHAVDLEHQAFFYPIKADAEELIALWNKNRSSQSQAADRARFKARNRRDAYNLTVVGRTMMVGGALLIGWGGLILARQYPSTFWPAVEGKIIFQGYGAIPSSARHPYAEVTLTYEYPVAGQTNQSGQYSLPHATLRDIEPTAAAFAQSHQRGAKVMVFYNPKHPEEAVLQTGPEWREVGVYMIGGGFLVFVGFLCRVLHGVAKRAQDAMAQ